MSSKAMTLILGGARSGKSRHAEQLVQAEPAPWTYVATYDAAWQDAEMRARIETHQARRGTGWRTVEAPRDLAGALGTDGPLLVDCLTLWLTNLMLAEADLPPALDALEHALLARIAPTVLVSSEVGLGVVPETALGRRFRDAAGLMHQRIAARADRVLLMVAGLPMVVK